MKSKDIIFKVSDLNEFDTTIYLSAKILADIELDITYDDNDSNSDEVNLKIELLKNGEKVKNGVCNTTVSRSAYEKLKKELLS